MTLVGQRRGLFIVLLLKSLLLLLSNCIFIHCCSVDVNNWRHGGFIVSALTSESSGQGSSLYPWHNIRWSTFLLFASVSEQLNALSRKGFLSASYMYVSLCYFILCSSCLNFSGLLCLKVFWLIPNRTNSQAHAATIPEKNLGTPCNICQEIYQLIPFPPVQCCLSCWSCHYSFTTLLGGGGGCLF